MHTNHQNGKPAKKEILVIDAKEICNDEANLPAVDIRNIEEAPSFEEPETQIIVDIKTFNIYEVKLMDRLTFKYTSEKHEKVYIKSKWSKPVKWLCLLSVFYFVLSFLLGMPIDELLIVVAQSM